MIGSLGQGVFPFPQRSKLRLHRRVLARELFDGKVLRLVVCQAQIPLATQQCLFRFLQMVDGLIDFIYSRLKLAASKVVIARKLCFEIFHRVFEVRDVDVLVTHFGKLGFILQGR